jgi:hypothetical protein
MWLDNDMTNSESMTASEARKMARWIHNNGRKEIQIVERFPDGACFIKCMTPAMQPRTYNTVAEVQADSAFWS